MAENQMREWLRKGGDDALQNKGKSLDTEYNRHKYAATSFGAGADYLQSKILADNNIKPPSIERRIELDECWEKLQVEIRKAYSKEYSKESPSAMEADEFCDNESTRELFGVKIEELNKRAKRVNDAIISDSLRFNGRSPVRHARPFHYKERIIEALLNNDDSGQLL